MKAWEILKGKKTYLLCVTAFAYAIVGQLMGWIDFAAAEQIVVTALVGAGLRHGIQEN